MKLTMNHPTITLELSSEELISLQYTLHRGVADMLTEANHLKCMKSEYHGSAQDSHDRGKALADAIEQQKQEQL